MLNISQLAYYYDGKPVLSIEHFHLEAGRHAIILGPSGSGKSTLLHLLAAVLTPQQGLIEIAGTDVGNLPPRAADAWRGRHIGLLPQQLALVASLSARENILLPAYARGVPPDPARADGLLAALGLAAKAHALPHQLSQGQRQRVALARAMYGRPILLLADEPSANLDDRACAAMVRLLLEQAGRENTSLVMASHDARLLAALPGATVLRLPARGETRGETHGETHGETVCRA